MRLSTKLVTLAATLTVFMSGYASANHLTVATKQLGAGGHAVSTCMSGSSMTFTYNLNPSGDLGTGSGTGSNPASPYGVVVGNIAIGCLNGSLTVELAGSSGSALASLGPVTIANSSPCVLVSGSPNTYTCDLQVSSTLLPGNVTDNYAVITGP